MGFNTYLLIFVGTDGHFYLFLFIFIYFPIYLFTNLYNTQYLLYLFIIRGIHWSFLVKITNIKNKTERDLGIQKYILYLHISLSVAINMPIIILVFVCIFVTHYYFSFIFLFHFSFFFYFRYECNALCGWC